MSIAREPRPRLAILPIFRVDGVPAFVGGFAVGVAPQVEEFALVGFDLEHALLAAADLVLLRVGAEIHVVPGAVRHARLPHRPLLMVSFAVIGRLQTAAGDELDMSDADVPDEMTDLLQRFIDEHGYLSWLGTTVESMTRDTLVLSVPFDEKLSNSGRATATTRHRFDGGIAATLIDRPAGSPSAPTSTTRSTVAWRPSTSTSTISARPAATSPRPRRSSEQVFERRRLHGDRRERRPRRRIQARGDGPGCLPVVSVVSTPSESVKHRTACRG